MRRVGWAICCASVSWPLAALGQAADPESRVSAFELGQIIVRAAPAEDLAIGSETLGQAAIEAFSRNSLDDAASLMKLLDALDEDDDVQTVWGNEKVPDEELERLA